jgi:low temperature requirement protein LtrA
MIIIKSRGQTLSLLNYIYHHLFFPHGQIHVAFPRIFSFDSVTVSLTKGHRQRIEKEILLRSNIVNREVLNSRRNNSFLLTHYCT